MRKTILALILLFPFFLVAQHKTDFSDTDKMARNTPRSASQSINKLADYLSRNTKTDFQKVRAFYVWITANIHYDIKLAENKKITHEKRSKKQQAENVLKSKKAVCEGYSNLFHELCLAADIPTEIVTGYSKSSKGRLSKIGHAWNVVSIDGNWYFLDSTWGAGAVDEKNHFHHKFSGKYFLPDPKEFILNHFPRDPLFQLSDKPITWETFQKKENDIKTVLSGKANPDYIHFQDSLAFFHTLNKEEKRLNLARRLLKLNPKSSYGNFEMAKYYINIARSNLDAYRTELIPLRTNPEQVKNSHIEKWQKLINDSKSKLTLAQEHLKLISPRDKSYQNALNAKKNIKIVQSNIRIDEANLKLFQSIVKRR